MPVNDSDRWWDTIPKEAVEELHIRQHPYHTRKRPRYECPLCWEQFAKELDIIVNGRPKPKAPVIRKTEEPKSTYQPPLKRILNGLRYWVEEE